MPRKRPDFSTEPIENNLMNTVDDKNYFNTENSKTSNKQNTAYMISENNFAIPNTLNQQLVEESEDDY